MEDLEQVKQKYKLSESEHIRIRNNIKEIMLYNKYPVKNPRAIIDIAPPASGKTGLNSYGNKQFTDGNVIIINSDELKMFHPKIYEIAKLYPEYYTKVTGQDSNVWTKSIFDEILKKGYNVIFEGTGRNTMILDTIISEMQDYNVTVRGMAVNELNCLMSILERYEYQVKEKGWGRLVSMSHFYETYKEMPRTIDAIEKAGVANSVEVFRRGILPSQPTRIYDSCNKGVDNLVSAKDAVLKGRIDDMSQADQYYVQNFKELSSVMTDKNILEEERKILLRIKDVHKSYKESKCEER